MKKRIIAWAVLLSVCAAALGLWCSAAAGKTARTLPCEDEGLILSITTFDGKSESKPFLKCFGHTWIGLDNRTGHTVFQGCCSIWNRAISPITAATPADCP